ncbi:MAG TPA: 1-deoxy-D-xylulose-5-phosphate reductoisomerase [Acidiferrobacteraceae bacterium]|nr:1-deoxy-D-xylulose-5-phosphate reductoisomerase [Acidiferrobacteraceae bacterium]HEX19220.1 1-deoxy-D-xylulose-5-phosphate reductoisomerase [Acidiferrobacteraceae bacterium]
MTISANNSIATTGLTILGSTGSIGVNTLDVVSRHPQRFRIIALTAHTQVDRLFDQCKEFKPMMAVMKDEEAADQLKKRLQSEGMQIEVKFGLDGLMAASTHKGTQAVMAAIVGAAGLLPTLEAVKNGKRVLLANKEPLVMSGAIFLEEAKKSGAQLLPIDSEHNAIYQCLPDNYIAGQAYEGLEQILLTCSGGPFLNAKPGTLVDVTPEQACAHPKWSMGRKISVDSATLMNKGLEVIEASWLFGVPPSRIQVVIHPQSVIHSMVKYIDGSVLAQMGNPDMRIPIAHALAWPGRIGSGAKPLDLFEIARLDFQKPDMKKFPCLQLAYNAAEQGGTAPAVLNAANEIAVEAFLERRVGFLDIPRIIKHTLQTANISKDITLSSILKEDSAARARAHDYINSNIKGVA